MNGRKAICLLSGGLDSATCLAVAMRDGFTPYCLSFDYGQRHAVELESARQIASHFRAREHRTIPLDLRVFGASSLTDDMEVPKHEVADRIPEGIPITYVPARNTIFLSLALAYAEVAGAWDIFLGVNAIDYSGYPDCRPEFIEAFERMARLATRAGVERSQELHIRAPLLRLSKSDIVRLASELGVPFELTHSCYDPAAGAACGRCDSCLLRRKGFEEAGLRDPIPYRA